MATAVDALPHWDMSTVFPSLESPEFAQGFQGVVTAIDDLARFLDKHGIEKRAPAPLDDETVATMEALLDRQNDLLRQMITLRAYIMGYVSTNSRDAVAQA